MLLRRRRAFLAKALQLILRQRRPERLGACGFFLRAREQALPDVCLGKVTMTGPIFRVQIDDLLERAHGGVELPLIELDDAFFQ